MSTPFYKISGYMTPADMLNKRKATKCDIIRYHGRKIRRRIVGHALCDHRYGCRHDY